MTAEDQPDRDPPGQDDAQGDGRVEEHRGGVDAADQEGAAEEDDELGEEVDDGRPGCGQREDLARQVDLLDDSRVGEDRGGGARDRLGEERPRRQPGEHVDGEVRDRALGREDLADGQIVDEQIDERADERPHVAEHRVLVPGLQLAPREPPPQLAMRPDVPDRRPGPREEPSAGRHLPHRLLAKPREPLVRRREVRSLVCHAGHATPHAHRWSCVRHRS